MINYFKTESVYVFGLAVKGTEVDDGKCCAKSK